MIEEDEDSQVDGNERKSFTFESLNRIIAILFVLAIYLVIFLKLLVLD
jgi:hypothetical protein